MYYGSIVLGAVLGLLQRWVDYYYRSKTAALIKKCADTGKGIFAHSSIWNFIKGKDYLSKIWEYSWGYRFINWILNSPAAFLSKIYHSHKQGVIQESRFVRLVINSRVFRLARLVFIRFEIVLGFSILFISVIEHRMWNNIYGTGIVGLLCILYFIKVIVQKFKGFNIKAIDFALFAFMITVILAEITALFPRESLRSFIFYATCFLFVLLISSSMRTARALNRLIEIILVGISITGVYALYQSFVGVPTDPSLTDLTLNAGMPGRVYSTMQNPNNYAEVLILTLPFFAAIIFNAESILRKLFFIGLALPPFIALFATGSRTSWIALVGAIMVLVFFKERRLIPIAILFGILSLPVLRVVKPSIYYRAMTIFDANRDTSYSYRGLIFDTFKPMLKDFWVTGIGLGNGIANQTFMKIIQRYPLADPVKMWTYPPHTHNLYLQVWIEAGLLGIVTFIWFIIRMIKKCMISIFKGVDTQISHILMAGVAAICGSLVMGLAEYTWFYPRAMLFFWIDIGIILAGLGILARKKEGLPRKGQL